jgi:hypothetical protein
LPTSVAQGDLGSVNDSRLGARDRPVLGGLDDGFRRSSDGFWPLRRPEGEMAATL